jgi:hypothetical protein
MLLEFYVEINVFARNIKTSLTFKWHFLWTSFKTIVSRGRWGLSCYDNISSLKDFQMLLEFNVEINVFREKYQNMWHFTAW